MRGIDDELVGSLGEVGDHQGALVGIDVEPVGSGPARDKAEAADENIVAGISVELIIARTTAQVVVATAAMDRVVIGAAIQRIVTFRSLDYVPEGLKGVGTHQVRVKQHVRSPALNAWRLWL